MTSKFFALIVIISTIFYVGQVRSEITFSPGAGLSLGFKSKEKDSGTNRPLLKVQPGFMLALDTQWQIISPLYFTFGGNYQIADAQAQYDYTDLDSPLDKASISDLDASITQFSTYFGARLKLLNFERIKFHIGGGLIYGVLGVNYSQSDFESKNGSSLGYKGSDSAGHSGHYYDANVEYRWNKENGLGLFAKRVTNNYRKLETLGNNEISGTEYLVTIQYVHVVDFSFFWK